MYSPSLVQHLSWRVLTSLLLLSTTLLAACSSPSDTPTPTVSFACDQPMPTPVQGQITLAGLDYGPFHAGQNPDRGIFPNSKEVAADMATLSMLTNYIRIYGSTGSSAAILQAAEASHVCVSLGIWLGKYSDANSIEIATGEELAKLSKVVRSVVVGSEVLQRGDLSEDQLHKIIQEVRSHLGNTVTITMADTAYQWLKHPKLAQDVDFLMVHIYPFWGNISIDAAIPWVNDVYTCLKNQFPTKPIIIGETGWPSATDTPDGSMHIDPSTLSLCPTQTGTVSSSTQTGAIPSPMNQARYFQEFTRWAQQHEVPYFYFDAFDEGWKTNEYGVGTHWGFYDESGILKPDLSKWLPPANPQTIQERRH